MAQLPTLLPIIGLMLTPLLIPIVAVVAGGVADRIRRLVGRVFNSAL